MKKALFLFFGCCLSLFSQAQDTIALIDTSSSIDTLRVGYTSAPPFIIEQGDKLEGVNSWLWNRVAKDLDIPFILQRMEFSEMLDAVVTGKIDLSINPLTITSDRAKIMEFTHAFYSSHSGIATYELSFFAKFKQFIAAFFDINFLNALIVLLGLILIFGFVAWLFERRENPEQFREGWRGIWDGLWWSAVTMSTVGYGDKAPKSRGGKIVALVWMFAGLLFISGFTATIASNLTVNQLQWNPKEFSEFKTEPVGSIKNSGASDFLQERFFRKVQLYKNVNEGLTDLSEEKIKAFLYDEPILKYIIQNNPQFERLNLLPSKFDLQLYAFGLPKSRSKLEIRISQKILEIVESAEWRLVLDEYGVSDF